ncbi:MAG TPA: SET domain-containing protein-lysine N-methyltransferase [Anaerolineales bacterium]|nr:SET domain-containing protein-lysine N-methyltransferase [Anaerolineales bacterium]
MSKPFFEVRDSPIHGLGGFATQRIRKGTRIIEYTGERITSEEGDRRYDDNRSEHPHVLLFVVDRHIVIDAGAGGNEARFINHSCEPNCRAVLDKKRVYIEALKAIRAGEELTYDYNLTREGKDGPETEKQYACHCGARTCRGTMLAPLKTKRPRT